MLNAEHPRQLLCARIHVNVSSPYYSSSRSVSINDVHIGGESAGIVYTFLNGASGDTGLNSTLAWPTSCEQPDVIFGYVQHLTFIQHPHV